MRHEPESEPLRSVLTPTRAIPALSLADTYELFVMQVKAEQAQAAQADREAAAVLATVPVQQSLYCGVRTFQAAGSRYFTIWCQHFVPEAGSERCSPTLSRCQRRVFPRRRLAQELMLWT